MTKLRERSYNGRVKTMVHVDGSYGEGGGQVLRTALSLSALSGTPFQIDSIRAGRKKPGLMAQHLTSVRAAARACGALVDGDRFGSTSVRFEPQKLRAGHYCFDVAEERGSAGSVGLVCQTVLPLLFFGQTDSVVEIIGGTHVPYSPPYHYVDSVLLPTLGKMGLDATMEIGSWGFYPKGGGRMRLMAKSSKGIRPLVVTERGRVRRLTGISAVANLPMSIADRQKKKLAYRLREIEPEAAIQTIIASSTGPGTFLFLLAEFEGGLAGFSSLGARGKRAEEVADEVADQFLDHYQNGAVFDPHLADQLLLYCAFARGRSSYTTSDITNHLMTNKWVVEQFLPVTIEIDESRGEVQVIGGSDGKEV